jgi:HEAT repeat protein
MVSVAKRFVQLETENAKVIDVLIRYLQDQDSSIQYVAVMTLLKLGILKEEIRDTLRSHLQVQDQMWLLAVVMLVNFFGEGKEEILRLLQDENEEVRLEVAAALADMADQEITYGKEINQEIIHVLQPLLQDTDNERRLNAAFYLMKLGVQNEETINAVLLFVQNEEDSTTLLDIVYSFAHTFGIRNDQMINLAAFFLYNEESKIQLSALQVLLILGVRNNEMINVALSLLQKEESDEILCTTVAEVLVTLGIANKELIDALLDSSLSPLSPGHERSPYLKALNYVRLPFYTFKQRAVSRDFY